MQKLAIFDMDRTITKTGTYTKFLFFIARRRAPWRLTLFPVLAFVMLGYPIRIAGRKTIKQVGFRLLIGDGISAAEMQRDARAFAEWMVTANTYADARARIAMERNGGATLIMATASPDFYAAEIGGMLGFDHVIGTTQNRTADGGYTARIDGPNCYGKDKLDRIVAWMTEQGIARSDAQISFYSDHSSDAVVHEWSDTPFAVNPNARLRAEATARGWPILTFS